MKGFLSLIAGSMLVLAACGSYEGVVTEKTDSSFIVNVSPGNSEAESTEHEMHLTDHTIFSGKVSSFEELEEGDHVLVVPFDTPSDFPYNLASEVIVE